VVSFEEIVDQAIEMLQRRGRVTYRMLKLQFKLDDDHLEALKDEILYSHPSVIDDPGHGLIWTAKEGAQEPEPLSYTPPHLAEKILTSRSALKASGSK